MLTEVAPGVLVHQSVLLRNNTGVVEGADGVLWHAAFGDVPRYGTPQCAEVLRGVRSHADWRARAAAGLPPEIAEDTPLDLYGLVTALPEGATEVPWAGPRVRVVEHPAHSAGHAALRRRRRARPRVRRARRGGAQSDRARPRLSARPACRSHAGRPAARRVGRAGLGVGERDPRGPGPERRRAGRTVTPDEER